MYYWVIVILRLNTHSICLSYNKHIYAWTKWQTLQGVFQKAMSWRKLLYLDSNFADFFFLGDLVHDAEMAVWDFSL